MFLVDVNTVAMLMATMATLLGDIYIYIYIILIPINCFVIFKNNNIVLLVNDILKIETSIMYITKECCYGNHYHSNSICHQATLPWQQLRIE